MNTGSEWARKYYTQQKISGARRRKYLELLVTGAELVLSDGNSAARALIVMVRI